MMASGPATAATTAPLRVGTGEAQLATKPTPRVVKRAPASGLAFLLFTGVASLVAVGGWMLSDLNLITPKSGVGYGLGVAGGGALLSLSMYPVRKSLRFMRGWGKLSHWFRAHMVLGALAPLLILFHCNFRPGAPNSKVALGSMLLVAASGLVGRYIYTHVSHGLYGARATLDDLHAQLDVRAHELEERLPPSSRASRQLAAFAEVARAPHARASGHVFRLVTLPLLALRVRRRVLHDFHVDLEREAQTIGGARVSGASEAATREVIREYLAALVKEVQFAAYERLFRFWHALHVPLFIMLLLTGVLHVIAVHMY